jgi:hypothetical protein
MALPLRAAPMKGVSKERQPANGTLVRTVSGRLIQLLGVVILAAAAFLAVAAFSGNLAEGFWLRLGGGLLAAVLGLAGGAAYKFGTSYTARSAEALTQSDPRPPVVYLRSFQDDRVTDEGSINHRMVSFLGALNSEEEDLAAVLSEIGPCIAVGHPGERLPQVGAARMYLRDAEWRDRVSQLMSSARLVAIRAGHTDGLWWEVATAARMVRPERLIFLIPFNASQYEAFRAKAGRYLPCRLPDYRPVHKRLRNLGSVRGFLYFEPNWKAHYRELKPLRIGNFRPLRRLFKFALEAVYRQLNIPWNAPGKWDLVWFVLSPVIGVLVVFVGFAIFAVTLRLLGVLPR